MEIAVLSKFMFDEPSVWVTVATVMTLLSTVYLGFAEIIGSHLQYSKFTNSSAKQAAAAGIKVSSRTGMLMLYTPAFVAGVVSFFVFPGGGVRFFLLKVVVTFHFFKRDFEVII
ncbi:putative 3-oxo-5-alpha-steroid 4-dehydrogenase/very-long-chain enoyl-CoA reductase [Helianthus annuus]|nr:putative 3-oxo-5-alpha-steroid 4-dehydrogenase/very-long-chain enoyl-CoA reductase [Helianthus annuus]KAJ0747259.1 putative 3-oxo-5-alpha-steroid 4-dehydrogenase/very-long-chain enoyl-CoA reductase [Helianthus annuus]